MKHNLPYMSPVANASCAGLEVRIRACNVTEFQFSNFQGLYIRLSLKAHAVLRVRGECLLRQFGIPPTIASSSWAIEAT